MRTMTKCVFTKSIDSTGACVFTFKIHGDKGHFAADMYRTLYRATGIPLSLLFQIYKGPTLSSRLTIVTSFIQ